MSEVKSAKSGFAEVPGARLYYEIAGDGEPVVFLHGGLLDGCIGLFHRIFLR